MKKKKKSQKEMNVKLISKNIYSTRNKTKIVCRFASINRIKGNKVLIEIHIQLLVYYIKVLLAFFIINIQNTYTKARTQNKISMKIKE